MSIGNLISAIMGITVSNKMAVREKCLLYEQKACPSFSLSMLCLYGFSVAKLRFTLVKLRSAVFNLGFSIIHPICFPTQTPFTGKDCQSVFSLWGWKRCIDNPLTNCLGKRKTIDAPKKLLATKRIWIAYANHWITDTYLERNEKKGKGRNRNPYLYLCRINQIK